MLTRLEGIIARAEELLGRLAGQFPAIPPAPDWNAPAFRWHSAGTGGFLEAIHHPHQLRLQDLQGVERQKGLLEQNTRQFVAGLPANNALLWGSRGTGKSSLVKALLNAYRDKGLRLVEVEPQQLHHLPLIVAQLAARPERFILFCDDLSFEAGDPGYKALKSALDGSLSSAPENVLIYATSNRRHLLPEYMSENHASGMVEGELHLADAVEEKISLSERFGLWLSFYPFNQDEYLAIVDYWLGQLNAGPLNGEARAEALRWAQGHASRSGRSAWQFARDHAGRLRLQQTDTRTGNNNSKE